MAFAPNRGGGYPRRDAGQRGPRWRSWPLRRSLKTAVLQGKCCRVWGSMPFGGSNGLVCLFFHGRRKYCHNGGMACAPQHGRTAYSPDGDAKLSGVGPSVLDGLFFFGEQPREEALVGLPQVLNGVIPGGSIVEVLLYELESLVAVLD
jgi:hypothetical protein